jgi:hypothetical protein
LRSRGSEDEQSLQNRLSQAIEDNKLSERSVFDLVIVNDDLEIAYKQLKQFITDVINSKYYIKISNKKRSEVKSSFSALIIFNILFKCVTNLIHLLLFLSFFRTLKELRHQFIQKKPIEKSCCAFQLSRLFDTKNTTKH